MSVDWLQGAAPQAVLRATRILHVSGISLAISPSARDTALAAMRQVRRGRRPGGVRRQPAAEALDAGGGPGRHRASHGGCDIFLPSLDDVTALNGLADPDAVIDWGHAAGARTVVLKLGADGCVASEGGRRERIAAHRVQAVDATGAGDCFSGNLLARLARGDDLFTPRAMPTRPPRWRCRAGAPWRRCPPPTR
jgi:2-dehydro-3-deoxygluconokinase